MFYQFFKLLVIILVLSNQITLGKGIELMEDKLIARETLFGNPKKVGVKISQDGKYISYIAPHKGVLNVWIAPVDDKSKAKLITSDKNEVSGIIYGQKIASISSIHKIKKGMRIGVYIL